jgi:multidrug efflux pump subunit AcrB
MQAHGLSTGEIVKAVNAENVLIPAGDVNIGD